ncbi:murein hydrolase activator EnvC family protein [Sphingomonas sp. GCM10030256]|uniref:murein hydrolase activator EnvC family protein n=1 Tax=Sphingomonas sp. GCM10030256 TaxID=3273427 RepID=UPI00361E52B3
MHRLLLLLAAPALLSATGADPAAQARAEAVQAQREAERLDAAARSADSDALRFRRAQASAAAAILAAEAGISAAEFEGRNLQRRLSEHRARLAREQRPAALLLAGLAQMGRRPPLLALADGGSVDDFVRMRALIAMTVPEVRRRSAALAAQVDENRRLAEAVAATRGDLARSRQQLAAAQTRFETLERQANVRSAALGVEALNAGDVALASADLAAALGENSGRARSTARLAAQLAALPPAPPRPGQAGTSAEPPAIRYQLPVSGRVLTGLSEISANGVRSRGLKLRSARGARVTAPADGRIAFAGPFRSREGVVIIDHGSGWMTLLTEVRTSLRSGDRVVRGDALGRALGDVTVELSRNGRPEPAALIARSSPLLSNGGNSG